MITSKFSSRAAVDLSNGKHSILSDISKELGGGDEGLNPHELVEAALAACTTLTLELYSKRKGWDLKNVKVEVSIVKEGAESEISRHLIFPAEFSPEMRAKLTEIANKCPIHKLLESKIKIQTYEK